MQFPNIKVPDNSVLQPRVFTSKCLTGSETHYSNMEREALGILHGFEKLNHYCFTCKVSMITGHKLLGQSSRRTCDPIMQAPKNPAMYPSIQNKDPV